MATTTTNLGLKKPALTDDALISDINDNMDDLDSVIGAVPSGTSLYTAIGTKMPMDTSVRETADCDNLTTTGVYRLSGTISNSPNSSVRLTLVVFESSSNFLVQIAYNNLQNDYGVYVRRKLSAGSWTAWKELASVANTNSWKLYNTNGNTYPTSSAFLVVVTKSGGNYASVMCHTNPSGCNIYFPTIASNCVVYFNGTGGFATSNLPSGYSVSIYTH